MQFVLVEEEGAVGESVAYADGIVVGAEGVRVRVREEPQWRAFSPGQSGPGDFA